LNKLRKAENLSELDSMALTGIVSSQLVFKQYIDCFPAKEIRPINPEIFIDRRSKGA